MPDFDMKVRDEVAHKAFQEYPLEVEDDASADYVLQWHHAFCLTNWQTFDRLLAVLQEQRRQTADY